MTYLDRETIIYRMDRDNPPAIRVKDGETLTVRTWDCFKGRLLPDGSSLSELSFDELNPATGPVFVEGAEPGDTLKVEILKIRPDTICVTEIDQDFGCLAPQVKRPQIRRFELNHEGVVFSPELILPLRLMIGVIGVAPAGEPVQTDTPGIHGGNMDCTQITEGAVLYLPVFAEGALLALGDLHAAMGDGEIGGCGAEAAGEVDLRLSVIKNEQRPSPYVIANGQLHIIASCPTVEESWKEAVRLLYAYLVEETKIEGDDAVMLLSLAADLAVCQTVNPNKTVRMSIPLSCLSAYGWMPR